MFIDPIANLIISIKNATRAHLSDITVANSKLLDNIVTVLKEQGYIADFSVNDIGNNKKTLNVVLKYVDNVPAITEIKQISKPGLRIYRESNKIPYVLNGLGIAIVSTSKGVVTDKYARKNNLGGEIIAYV
jgi:small subunit ribosomal protein S8